jgi:hypothetical protein
MDLSKRIYAQISLMKKNNLSYSQGTLNIIRNIPGTRFFSILIMIVLLGVGLSSCVTINDPEASQDYTADTVGTLDARTILGQSFVSRRPDFNGLTVWVSQLNKTADSVSLANSNNLEVQLFTAPGDRVPIFSTTIVIPPSGTQLPINISIPNQANPPGQSYYIQLVNTTGCIQVNGRNEDAYPLGQAYMNSQPLNADIAFRLSYDYGFSSLIGDIVGSLSSIWLIIPLIIVLWLPGWLLLDFSGLKSHYDFGGQVALAIGFSLAVTPLLMLWTSVMKLKWTTKSVEIAAGILIAIFIYRLIYNGISLYKTRSLVHITVTPENSLLLKQGHAQKTITSLALILVFLATLTTRLVMIRDLATPAWVDSVHHALITSLILDKGAFPATYQPFIDISSSAYHAGFHSIAAAFTWLSQLDLARSLLILGQVLNALTVFSIYLLAKAFTRSPGVGLFAAIISSSLTPMPAYYTSWGRYTELTGLLLLPVIIMLIQSWIDNVAPRKTIWIIASGAISAGGLFMIHYRVLAFMACLVFLLLIFHILRNPSSGQFHVARLLLIVSSMAILGIILTLPWFIQAFRTSLLPYITTVTTSSVPLFQGFTWSYLASALGKQALVLAGLGVVWGIIKKQRLPFIMIAWVILLFFLANLGALKLPGGEMVNISSVEIMLFIPISILGGYFIHELLAQWKEIIPNRLAVPSLGILVVFSGFVVFLGARQLVPILNPITILTRNADLQAIQWISENIPASETIVINPFAWGYGLYAGNDGGFWISPLSGRKSLPPPVLYGISPEASQINSFSQQVISLAPDPTALWELMHSYQLHYIFIGARGGVFFPGKLTASNLFSTLYHQAGAWVLAVKP